MPEYKQNYLLISGQVHGKTRLIPYVDEQKVSIRVLYLGGYRSQYPMNSGIIVTAGWDFYPWS